MTTKPARFVSAAETSESHGCQSPEPAAPSSNSQGRGGNDEVAVAEVEEADAEEEAAAEDEAAAGELEGATTTAAT